MIIDSFLFFNELDLLEIRLETLDQYVDKFLIVESHHTFQGDAKPLYFAGNRERFAKFNDRIIHVVADLPQGDTYEHGWERERASRDAVIKGLEGVPGDAILLLSDLDEIPNLAGWDSNREVPACWSHQLYYYYVDLEVCPIKGTVAIPVKTFREHPEIQGAGSKLREWRHYNPKFVFGGTRGGWHFSYLGGVDAIQAKIRAFAHAELNPHANKENIRKALEENWKNGIDLFNRDIYQFKHVKDGDLPKFLVDNRERFERFWMPEKLPLPCGLTELPDHVDGIEVGGNAVESGPITFGFATESVSDAIQEGTIECEKLEESVAPESEDPGLSGSEMTEQPSSTPSHVQTTYELDPGQDLCNILEENRDELLRAHLAAIQAGSQTQIEASAQEVLPIPDSNLLETFQAFESADQEAELPDPVEKLQAAESDDQSSDPTRLEP